MPTVLHRCFSTPVAEFDVGEVAEDAVPAVILDAVQQAHHRLGTGEPRYEARIELGTFDPVVSDDADVTWTAVLVRGGAEGTLVLRDPRRIPATIGGQTLFPSSFGIGLRPGLLVVFPGWLERYATGPVHAVKARVQCFPVTR